MSFYAAVPNNPPPPRSFCVRLPLCMPALRPLGLEATYLFQTDIFTARAEIHLVPQLSPRRIASGKRTVVRLPALSRCPPTMAISHGHGETRKFFLASHSEESFSR